MTMFADQLCAHPLAGQRVGHEYGLAFNVRRTASVVGKIVDGGFECRVARRFRHPRILDRKSTRLNSSHMSISYAVFCLKKKNKNTRRPSLARQVDHPSP